MASQAKNAPPSDTQLVPAFKVAPNSHLVALNQTGGNQQSTLASGAPAASSDTLELNAIDCGPPLRVAPPNIPGTGAPLPAGFLQFTPDTFGRIVSNWYFLHTSERLKVAVEKGISLEQLVCSPATGLIEFPGFGDALIPEAVSALEIGHPQQIDQDLWNEFLTVSRPSSTSPDVGALSPMLSRSG
jgi:hypothetical protein